MPEGDTLFRIATTLGRALAGKRVVRASGIRGALEGREVERVESRGKHLLIHFSGGLTLRTHLRMNGAWHIYRPGETWKRAARAEPIVIETPEYVAVGFDIPVVELLNDRELARDRPLRELGPDLLAPDFDRRVAAERLRMRGGPIGDALLDQRALAGIGNIFRCESLFLAGIHPSTPVAALDAKLELLVETARRLLSASARTSRDRFWVYERAGQPCRRCGARIAWTRGGEHARSIWWCPKCQPAPDADRG